VNVSITPEVESWHSSHNLNLSTLVKIHKECLDYCQHVEAGGWIEKDDDESPFWRSLFAGRENYPDMNGMLLMRRGATQQIEPNLTQTVAKASYSVMLESMPENSLDQIEESSFGAPMVYPFGSCCLSASGMINGLTVSRILLALEQAQMGERHLKVLEIGAGFGLAALMLIKKLKIESYTICDLPKNLFLSSFYLRAHYPDINSVFLRDHEKVDNRSAGLIFVVPPFLENVKGQFDLVVNSYSFQEMNLYSVKKYFELIKDRLAEDGVFYSLNSHSKAGVSRASDYSLNGFEVVSFSAPRRGPFQLFATEPYELVLRKSRVGKKGYSSAFLDAIGFLVQLGFKAELMPLFEIFCLNDYPAEQATFLEKVKCFFEDAEPQAKKEVILTIQELGLYSEITQVLHGLHCFCVGDHQEAFNSLQAVLPKLSKSSIKDRCLVVQCVLAKYFGNDEQSTRCLEELDRSVPYLIEEIATYIKNPDWLNREIRELLRMKPGTRSALSVLIENAASSLMYCKRKILSAA
jgi:putative sugar O-methyltransferase